MALAVAAAAVLYNSLNVGTPLAQCPSLKAPTVPGSARITTNPAHPRPLGARPEATAIVAGDSVVAVAARSGPVRPGIALYGYGGEEPCQYSTGLPSHLRTDFASAGGAKTVVFNWNGNNPRHLSGPKLVAAYRHDLTGDIHWYLAHGVTKIILAAAIPSVFNNGAQQVSLTSADAARPGWMLGNSHLNDMYRQLAHEFPGKVFYTDAAARILHPGLAFNTSLNGHACIADYIHETPYCAKIYAQALALLGSGKADRYLT